MTVSPTHLHALAVSGQIDSTNITELIYWCSIPVALLIGAVLYVTIARKLMGSGGKARTPAMSLGAIDEMGEKGLLTPDEKKRVRDVIVKGTLNEREAAERMSLAQLQVIALQDGGGPPGTGLPQPPTVAPEMPNVSADVFRAAVDDEVVSTDKPPKDAKSAAVGIEELLERGLISKKDYEAMRKVGSDNDDDE